VIGNTTIEIVKRTGTGVIGTLGIEQTTEETITVTGCSLQLNTTTETTTSTTSIATLTGKVFMPANADTEGITPRDAIRHGGRDYEVVGPAVVGLDLNDKPDHVRVHIKRQEG